MKRAHLVTVGLLLALGLAGTTQASAQENDNGFFSGFFERSSRSLAEQPHWLAPIFTATPRLEEMYVYDISSQNTAKGDVTNFGGAKGLLFIPSENTNLLISPPPYITHNFTAHDGFGDMGFLMRYRLLSGNEESGNYILTAFLGSTIPTGSYSNGAKNAVITPSIGGGKGWGHFDFQSTLGVGIPLGNVSTLGTPVLSNTAFQYNVLKKLWPEVDVNATFFPNGTSAGKNQVFLSPGLILGKFHLWKRLNFAVGGGIQIAATHYHTFNHNRVLTLRFPF